MTGYRTHHHDVPWLLLLLVAVVCFSVGNCTGYKAALYPPEPRSVWPANATR